MAENRLDPIPLLAGAAVAAAAFLAVDAFLIEPTRVQVAHHDLPVPDLPAAWEGARVVHLTDIHYGDPRSDWLFRGMVRTVNALEPDLVVITGDFVLNDARQAGPCARYLSRLRARHGVLGVLGDHDYNLRTRELFPGLLEALAGAGVRILRNEAVELPGGLQVAGIDSNTRKIERSDLSAALAAAGGRPHLFLAHSPDSIEALARAGVPVVLCGHTHGGQVVVPFFGPPVTHSRCSRKYVSGWSSRGKTRMYCCRGLASHHSLRFLCPPEIAVFRLVRAEP